MWKTIPDASYYSEPAELRDLKQQLATNSCRCRVCGTHGKPPNIDTGCYDKEVQVSNGSFHRYPQMVPHKLHDSKSYNSFHKEVFCPGCYMAITILRNKDTKVLKDEESETRPEMFSSDKATESIVKFVEKTTSTTIKPQSDFSNISICEMMSEYSTDMSVSSKRSRKRNIDKVTFKENPKQVSHMQFSSNCLCMENFINSIRPPLIEEAIHRFL